MQLTGIVLLHAMPCVLNELLYQAQQHLHFVVKPMNAGLERIWVVCSMNPAITMGRESLAPRLAALLKVAYMGYPSSDDLLTIYSSMLGGCLSQVGCESGTFSLCQRPKLM